MEFEKEVDINLYHLQCVLFDLNSYSFDDDITKILNDLKSLVDKKIFDNIDFNDLDDSIEKITFKYYITKEKM